MIKRLQGWRESIWPRSRASSGRATAYMCGMRVTSPANTFPTPFQPQPLHPTISNLSKTCQQNESCKSPAAIIEIISLSSCSAAIWPRRDTLDDSRLRFWDCIASLMMSKLTLGGKKRARPKQMWARVGANAFWRGFCEAMRGSSQK